jgi:hypothetical protein
MLLTTACCALVGACAPTAATEKSQDPSLQGPSATATPDRQPALPADQAVEGLCDGRAGVTVAGAEQESASTPAQDHAADAIRCDAYAIMARISAVGIPAAEVTALREQVSSLARGALGEIRATPPESSRLPLSPSHQRMYEVAAQAERTAGAADLQVWTTNPWRPLDPLERAGGNAQNALAVTLMRGERRALALNLRSSSSMSRSVQLEIQAPRLAAGALQLYRVNWTGNDASNWAAAELEPLGDARAARQTVLLPGVTEQLWIQICPGPADAADSFAGGISLTTDDGQTSWIPLTITVLRTRLPPRPSLHFGGWDYADGRVDEHYSGIDFDQSELVKLLQDRDVDTPWARSRVMPWAARDAAGNLDARTDAAPMEQWLARWTDARRFRIFLNVGDDIAGIPVGDERFADAVAAWAQSWAAEIRRLGKSPEQFDLLLVDEPHSAEQARLTELWARALRESGAGFRIWSDPLWRDPSATPRSLIDAVDTVSVNIGIADRAGTAYWDWARQLSHAGKTLEIYGTEGPARRLDPYTYYRLTMWKAFFLGAAGVSFWSFADTGGAASDDEFSAQRVNYSPLFITPQIRSGKHLEAAFEGVQDTQYLEMLQQVADNDPTAGIRQRASQLLNDARAFVARAPSSTNAQWAGQTESTEADRLRVAIGEFLDSLVP